MYKALLPYKTSMIRIGMLFFFFAIVYLTVQLFSNTYEIKKLIAILYFDIATYVLSLISDTHISLSSHNCIHFPYNNISISLYVIIGIRYYIVSAILSFLVISDVKKALYICILFWIIIPFTSIFYIILSAQIPEFITKSEMFSFYFEATVVGLLLSFIIAIYKIQRIALALPIEPTVKSLKIPYYVCVALLATFAQITLYYSYFKDYLANVILYGSKAILHIFGYNPFIEGRGIRGDGAWLGVMNPCLGINILLVFTFIMLLLKGSLQRKLPYLGIGIFLIVFINILRIVGLYLYVSNNQGTYSGIINTHDVYNYPVYIAVVTIWLVYIHKEYTLHSRNKQ